jgi:hypothetical protein
VLIRLQGSGLCDVKPDRCVALHQIDSSLPDGRWGTPSPLSAHEIHMLNNGVLYIATLDTFSNHI